MSLLAAPVCEVAWAAIDFEGTGADPGQSDEAVQVGIAILAPGREEPEKFFRSFIRAESRVTRAAASVHRITDRDIENAPPLTLLWPEIKSRLSGAVVIAHGAGTEKRFLRAFPMHGFGPWIDTLALARAVLPVLDEHSLASVAAEVGVVDAIRSLCPGLDWHDALFDAVASLLVAHRIISRFGLQDLAVAQINSLDTTARAKHRAMRSLARDAGLDG
jgi:DNA polymerase-3 subunit epsilon